MLIWGRQVHEAFERALKQSPAGQLPAEMAPYQKFVDRLADGGGELLVEQSYALTKDLSPCNYYSPVAWYRSKNDAVRISKKDKFAIAVDWKTGRRKDPEETNNLQLMLGAQCVFSTHPEIEYVLSRFCWLEEDAEDDQLWTRQKCADVWASNLLPRVQRYLDAAEHDNFPPNPSGLCVRYCPVTVCAFHGRGSK